MKRLLWHITRPIDWIIVLFVRLATIWRWWRLSLTLDQEDTDPMLQEMSAQIKKDREGYKYEVKAFLEKNREVIDLGFHFMEFMDYYGDDAPNYVSVCSFAPDGKRYTLSVEREGGKPKHVIIIELKDRIAELEASQ